MQGRHDNSKRDNNPEGETEHGVIITYVAPFDLFYIIRIIKI